MYKNEQVRAVDIWTWPTTVQGPPCKQDNNKILSQDMQC